MFTPFRKFLGPKFDLIKMNEILQNFGKGSKRIIDTFEVYDLKQSSNRFTRCSFQNTDGLLKFEVINNVNPLYTVLMNIEFAAVDASLPLHAYDIFPLRTANHNQGIVLVLLFKLPVGKTLLLDYDLSEQSDLLTIGEFNKSVYVFLRIMCDENLNPNAILSDSFAFLRDDDSDEVSMVLLDTSKAETNRKCTQMNLNNLKRVLSNRLKKRPSEIFTNMMKNVTSSVRKYSSGISFLQEQTNYVDKNFDYLPKPLQIIDYM
jgi:hypothetical protein